LLAAGAVARESERTCAYRQVARRAGVPEKSIFFVVKDANGKLHGVTADIAGELANKLHLPLEYVLFPNPGLATDVVASGAQQQT
jgi:hypothetical protein